MARESYDREKSPLLLEVAIINLGKGPPDRVETMIAAYASHFLHIVAFGVFIKNFSTWEQDRFTTWPCESREEVRFFPFVCLARILRWLSSFQGLANL